MKKGWIIALGLLLAGAIGAYIWYNRLKSNAEAEGGPYDNTLQPRIEMSRLEITDIDDETIRLNVHLLIDNPLPVGLKSPRLDYTVYIANTPVVVDAYKKPINVKSGDSTLVILPIKVLTKKLTQVLGTLDRKDIDSTTYKTKTTFPLDIPILGQKLFTVTTERRAPTFYIPKIKIDGLDFGKMTLKRSEVAAKVSVLNKNKFPINITDAHYTVTIDGKKIAEGDQPEPILIKPQATTPVIFPVTGESGKTLSVLPKMLFDKKNTPFIVDFRCKILDKDDNPTFKNSKFGATIKGTLDELKKK